MPTQGPSESQVLWKQPKPLGKTALEEEGGLTSGLGLRLAPWEYVVDRGNPAPQGVLGSSDREQGLQKMCICRGYLIPHWTAQEIGPERQRDHQGHVTAWGRARARTEVSWLFVQWSSHTPSLVTEVGHASTLRHGQEVGRVRAEKSRSEEPLSYRKFGLCQRGLPPSCRCPPPAGPSTVQTGLEGQRLKVVEGAGGPPRDLEEFPSSPLAPSLAMCLLKALVLLPVPLSVLCSPQQALGSVANLLHGLRGSNPAQEQRSKLAPLPKVHPHCGRAQPGQYPWCHGTENSK